MDFVAHRLECHCITLYDIQKRLLVRFISLMTSQKANLGDEKWAIPGGMNSEMVVSTLSTVEEDASFDA